MNELDTIGAWLGGLAATVLAALGIRLQWSKVSKQTALNDAESQHSSQLIESLNYWRQKSEIDSQRAFDANLLAAGLKADLMHLAVIREERDSYKKIAESQSRISADLSKLADARAAQLDHVQSNYRLKLRLLKRQCPDIDFSILDSGPAPLGANDEDTKP